MFLHVAHMGWEYLPFDGNHAGTSPVETHQNFFLPITYGQELTASLWTSNIQRSSVVFHYQLFSPSSADKVIHAAWTKHVFVGKKQDSFVVLKFPEKLVNIFRLYRLQDEFSLEEKT